MAGRDIEGEVGTGVKVEIVGLNITCSMCDTDVAIFITYLCGYYPRVGYHCGE